MRLDIVDRLCEPGEGVNEDLVGGAGLWHWVLDGATGLADDPILRDESDALWYVKTFDAALKEELSRGDRPLQSVVAACILRTADAFRRASMRDPVHRYELPSSAMALVRLTGTELDCVTLGDCRVLVLCGEGQVRSVGGSTLGALDARTIAEVADLQRRGVHDARELRARVIPLLRQHRSLMNTASGYWILGLDPEAADHLRVARVGLAAGDLILLVSDGFYRIVDTFKLLTDLELMRRAHTDGLRSVLEWIRAVERADPELTDYPRLKGSDDAAALLLRVVAP